MTCIQSGNITGRFVPGYLSAKSGNSDSKWTDKNVWNFTLSYLPHWSSSNSFPHSFSFLGLASMWWWAPHHQPHPLPCPPPAPRWRSGRGRAPCSSGRRESVCSSREKRPGKSLHTQCFHLCWLHLLSNYILREMFVIKGGNLHGRRFIWCQVHEWFGHRHHMTLATIM